MSTNVKAYRLMQEIDKRLRKKMNLPAHLPAREVIDKAVLAFNNSLTKEELDRLWHLNYLRHDLMNFETISPAQIHFLKEVRQALFFDPDDYNSENQHHKDARYVQS
ncbi:hypothetical protein ABC345_09560 [Shouchella sp. 1P09AA]|uniref:hypothetical protein n=1 Tax=unclassified Shouchella TaxID=2893065 RepID=UPI0039A12860